jgi:adenylate cyclase|nr:MAG: adenylate cyclase [bacterium]
MIEIERRFLCRVADTAALEREGRRMAIQQGYLTLGAPTVRIRQKDGAYLLTIKSGSGRVRQEVEVPVGSAEGETLMAMAGEHRLEKVRYAVGRWEIDIYGDKLAGLVLAEVELEHEDEPLPPPPAWLELAREVTDDPAFTNQRLARLGPDEAARFVREANASRDGRRASGRAGV